MHDFTAAAAVSTSISRQFLARAVPEAADPADVALHSFVNCTLCAGICFKGWCIGADAIPTGSAAISAADGAASRTAILTNGADFRRVHLRRDLICRVLP